MLLICIISFLSYQRIFFTLGTLIYRWCFRLYCTQKAITWTSVDFLKFCWSWNCGSVDTMYQIRLSDVYICYSSYYHLKTKQNRANRYFSAVLEWLPHWPDDAHVMGMKKGYIYIYICCPTNDPQKVLAYCWSLIPNELFGHPYMGLFVRIICSPEKCICA